MLKKAFRILAVSLTLTLGCNSTYASPTDTLNELLNESSRYVIMDTNNTPSYGKITKGNRPSNSLCEVGMFYLDTTSIVTLNLSNKADDGIVYYQLAKNTSTNNHFDEFGSGNYTVVLPKGQYFLKTNFLSLDTDADAKYKAQIAAVDIPQKYKQSSNHTLSRAYAIEQEEEVLNSFCTNSAQPKPHYYKFSITEKVQPITLFAKQASNLGNCTVEILDNNGKSLTKELRFNSDNIIDKSYKILEGDYYIKVNAKDDHGAVYFFRLA